VEVLLGGVPEVKPRSSVPSHEIGRPGSGGAGRGRGGEDGVVLERKPFDIVVLGRWY